MAKILEKDLFIILKTHFQNQGFEVQAEVMDVDLIFYKPNFFGLVELKLGFNVTVIYQALERKKICDDVYIAVTKPKKYSVKEYHRMRNLCKLLTIGLIVIDPITEICKVIIEPSTSQIKKTKLKKFNQKFQGLVLKNPVGGVTNQKIFTLYFQECFKAALIVRFVDVITPKQLREFDDLKITSQKILGDNYYGWFEKVSRGKYKLSKLGLDFLVRLDDPELITFKLEYENKVLIQHET